MGDLSSKNAFFAPQVLVAALIFVGALKAQPLKLHVPSPDWRDQVIYFVMTDRFADGDPTNNDQGADEFKAGDRSKFNGGDLRGLTQKLDYIKGLGATAVWITPPVANQWYEPNINYTGYHGYWTEHFKKADAHLGSLEDYKALSDGLHRRNMYLVQDIVVNHTGNFFEYVGGWDARDPAKFYTPSPKSRAVTRPSQAPFDLNDPRIPAHRAANIYHWTPAVKNYADKNELRNFQMSSLDDLNTENPRVRRALRESYGYWISEVGVDAFRVDTAVFVPPTFFRDFLHSKDPTAPGINQVAKKTGRAHFLSFGEGFALDKPFTSTRSREIEAYVGDAKGPLLSSMINFPLYGTLSDVFARGHAPAALADRIQRMMQVHKNPHVMPSFLDNHDVDRFLSYGSEAALQQALVAMFTLPGIPTIYYGTEQGFKETRAAMFSQGWGSGGKDHFNTQHPLYQTIAELAQLRRTHKALSRGTPVILNSNAARAGALVYAMRDGARTMVVALNTAEHETLVDGFNASFLRNAQLAPRFGAAPTMDLNAKGSAAFTMPARSAWVWEVGAGARAVHTPVRVNLSAASRAPAGDFIVRGTTKHRGPLQLVVDGDMSKAETVMPDAGGNFAATIATHEMSDPNQVHRVSAWVASGGVASIPISFKLNRPWRVLAQVVDPAGDDRGPSGNLSYPTDGSYTARQMDLRRVRVWGNGGAMKIEIGVPTVTANWNPANGFDHVAFTVFIELPNEAGGATVMPQQQGALPQGMRWHRRVRVHGWSNATFSDHNASAEYEGTPIAPGASIEVSQRANTISLTLPASTLGGHNTLSGAKVYVTTWDYDNGYRKLEAQAQPFSMGGPVGSPLVMDDSGVIQIP